MRFVLSLQNIVFVNQELVARDFAEWCEPATATA